MAFERINLVSGLLAAVVGVVGLGIAIYNQYPPALFGKK